MPRFLPIAALALFAPACLLMQPPAESTTSASPHHPTARPPYHDPAFDHPASELEPFIAKNTKGFTKQGPLVKGTLEDFQPVAVTLQRGHCYRMVLRLADDATISNRARKGIAFIYRNGDRGMEVHGGPGMHGPTGGVASGGCPQQTAHATFDMIANWGSALDKSHLHDLGTGAFTLQLYSKPISKQELAARKADEERQIAESEAFERQERQKKHDRMVRGCRVCEDKYTECLADWRRGASKEQCREDRDSCVFSEAGLPSAADCR